ncbi:hypothetical protein ARUE_c21880 [Arthrobacter sp. Rue61a]|nr:hypothetical protein ARUE_c21880 [Arthrobacter sp. Rue61a]
MSWKAAFSTFSSIGRTVRVKIDNTLEEFLMRRKGSPGMLQGILDQPIIVVVGSVSVRLLR